MGPIIDCTAPALLRGYVSEMISPMGNVHKFQRRPRHKRRAPAPRGGQRPPSQRENSLFVPVLTTVAPAIILGGSVGFWWLQAEKPVPPGSFSCVMPRVIDGDTFDCANTRVRLQGIDAPETEGHCRPGRDCAPGDPSVSTANLRRLVRWNKVICRKTETDAYGRMVARCSAGEVDLSCAQVEGGFAILRYAPISC